MFKRNLLLSLAIFWLGMLTACANNKSAPVPTTEPSKNATSSATGLPASISTPNIKVKEVFIADKYVIEIPEDFVVHKFTPSPSMQVLYSIEAPDGTSFEITLHPYVNSPALVQGQCTVSMAFDAGDTSAPIYCEGLEMSDLFTTPGGWHVKYGRQIYDLSQNCTMNSPCNTPSGARYSISSVFVVPDKSLDTILEFYAGDAFRTSSSEIQGFEGLAAVLRELIIPSLATTKP